MSLKLLGIPDVAPFPTRENIINARDVQILGDIDIEARDGSIFIGQHTSGTFRISGLAPGDILRVPNKGTGADEVRVEAGVIYFGGASVGVVSGGFASLDLVIRWGGFGDSPNVTTLAMERVIESIVWGNRSDTPAVERTFVYSMDLPTAGKDSVPLTLRIQPENDLPVVTSGATASVLSGFAPSKVAYRATATDPDNAVLYWTIGGVDAARFTLNDSGEVRFRAAPDVAAPADAGGDNVYNITLTAWDESFGRSEVKAVAITVRGANAAPTGGVTIGLDPATDVLRAGNTLADADGIGAVTYIWQARSPGTGAWSNITGGVGPTLGPLASLDEATLRVLARYVDGEGRLTLVASSNWAVRGGAGHDDLDAPAARALLSGGAGNDTLSAATFAATMDGGIGNDLLLGGSAPDSLSGGTGNDTLSGGAFGDWLDGGGGNDALAGGLGNDTLLAGTGFDTLIGDTGQDSFLLSARDGLDRIRAFSATDDTILLRGAAFGNLPAGPIGEARFVAGTTPDGAVAQVLYSAGILRFDPDGTGAAPATAIAVLVGAPSITAADIVIV